MGGGEFGPGVVIVDNIVITWIRRKWGFKILANGEF